MSPAILLTTAAALVTVAAMSASGLELDGLNITCVLVFGDSTVDAGNNNKLDTTSKANFPPYGKDFFDHVATGRFSDGRLATDFIAEDLGIARSIPAFLDPNVSEEQLRHGVSFASASSGYDELTASLSNVLSLGKQVEYFRVYKERLSNVLAGGEHSVAESLRTTLFVISAGTNDFILNYYLQRNRSLHFTLPEYQDFLINCMSHRIKELHDLGGQLFAVVGVPPMGCLPVVKTFSGSDNCVSTYNDAAAAFNSKLRGELTSLSDSLRVRTAYVDVFDVMLEATKNPAKFGLEETSKGCCGSGFVEFGETCKGEISTCENPDNYLYWDAVHPTEKMYNVIAGSAASALQDLFE